MYAVIKTGGKQYRVASGDILKIEKLPAQIGVNVEFDQVLMVVDDETVIGSPLIEGARVTAEVIEHSRGKKIIIFKKSRRKHYRRRNGHRQHETIVRIGEVSLSAARPSVKDVA
ncbi:MAG: 50S ribosomal protein L21 [Alphaproteobacteria bacterium]|nr:50S ribosomal protein L21 [Alphaproteobacteria bacterium]